jgi:hypothetical protein
MRYIATAFLLLVSTTPLFADCWYPAFQHDQITECQNCKSLDLGWQWLNQQVGPCQLDLEGNGGITGFIFRCQKSNAQFLFRSRKDCEYTRRTMNSGAKVNWDEFAPTGTKHREGWTAAYSGCLKKSATPQTMSRAGLQNISSYCESDANEVAVFSEKEFAAQPKLLPKVMSKVLDVCLPRLKRSIAEK